MKKLIVPALIALVAGFAAPVMAADKHAGHGQHTAMPAPASGDAQLTDGVVKKIDKTAGRVTLAHGPLNGMPGMTMAFRVKDAAWIGQMKEGQKIRFAANEINGVMTMVQFEAAK